MYQPSITRIPSLLFLLVLSLLLIALTEVAIRRLPANNNGSFISSAYKAPVDINSAISARYIKRSPQVATTTAGAPNPDAFVPLGNEGGTSAPAPGAFLPVTTSPTPAAAAATATATTRSHFAAFPSAFVPVNNDPPSTNPAANPVVLGTIKPGASPAPGVGGASPNNAVPTAPQAPAPGEFLPLSNSNAANGPPIATQAVGSQGTGGPAAASQPVSPVNNQPTTSGNNATPGPTTGAIGGVAYTVGPDGLLAIDGHVFTTSTPTTSTLPDGLIVTVDPTGGVTVAAHQGPISITPSHYVLGAFIPTLVAVIFAIPWRALSSAIKEMEPFYQLQNPNGVTARKSLTVEYRTSINVVSILSALRNGHFMVWWSGLTALFVLLLAPLASETIFIGFAGAGRCTAKSGRAACSPELSVFPPAARTIQAILVFVSVLTLALAIAFARRQSGVWANPLSIAGIATLFQNLSVLEHFQRIRMSNTDSKKLSDALQSYRYRITEHIGLDGNVGYGLAVVDDASQQIDQHSSAPFLEAKEPFVAVDPAAEPLYRPEGRKRSIVSRICTHESVIISFGVCLCGLIALVVYYKLVGTDTPFERFMDSNTFGPSFIFTLVGVAIKQYWTYLDDDLRRNIPYRMLSHRDGHAPRAAKSILAAPPSGPFEGIFYSLRRGSYLSGYLSLLAILAEVLTICLANIPFKPGLAFMAYTVATWLTVAIVGLMLIGIVLLLISRYQQRVHHDAQAPENIAEMLWLLCGSHMLPDFQGLSRLDRRERDSIIKSWNKQYGLGSVVGVDGVEREGIDENIFVRDWLQ